MSGPLRTCTGKAFGPATSYVAGPDHILTWPGSPMREDAPGVAACVGILSEVQWRPRQDSNLQPTD